MIEKELVMGWGFNNDEALREYLRKVEEAHPNAFDLPGTDEDKSTPLWMSGLNKLYEGRKADSQLIPIQSYRDKILDKDTDLSTYDAKKEFDTDEESKRNEEYKKQREKEKADDEADLSGFTDYLFNHMLEKHLKNNHYDSEDSPARKFAENAIRKSADKWARFTPRRFSFLDEIQDYPYSKNLDKAYQMHKHWLKYKDDLARKRGIRYPNLRYANGEYLEDYMYDDFGNPIDKDDAFTNNINWFKERYDIPIDMEYELKDILKQNRADLTTKNIIKALRPGIEGGVF